MLSWHKKNRTAALVYYFRVIMVQSFIILGPSLFCHDLSVLFASKRSEAAKFAQRVIKVNAYANSKD